MSSAVWRPPSAREEVADATAGCLAVCTDDTVPSSLSVAAVPRVRAAHTW